MGHKAYDKKYGNGAKKFDVQLNDVCDDNISAKRFFVKDAHVGLCTVDGEEHNHLANVMRLKPHDEVILICDDEFDYFGEIVEIKKNETTVNVTKRVLNNANPKISITAFIAMNRREHMSLMVRMLSELGVSTFVPIITKWTLGQDITDKIERYQKIADQSVKQCRRSKTLKVEKPKKLDEVCKMLANFDKVFFAYENETNTKLQFESGLKNIAFLIGPVAGFDKDEAEKIVSSGATSVSLGQRILRADTACIMIASVLSNNYLE